MVPGFEQSGYKFRLPEYLSFNPGHRFIGLLSLCRKAQSSGYQCNWQAFLHQAAILCRSIFAVTIIKITLSGTADYLQQNRPMSQSGFYYL
jgi:hypothetical protein